MSGLKRIWNKIKHRVARDTAIGPRTTFAELERLAEHGTPEEQRLSKSEMKRRRRESQEQQEMWWTVPHHRTRRDADRDPKRSGLWWVVSFDHKGGRRHSGSFKNKLRALRDARRLADRGYTGVVVEMKRMQRYKKGRFK